MEIDDEAAVNTAEQALIEELTLSGWELHLAMPELKCLVAGTNGYGILMRGLSVPNPVRFEIACRRYNNALFSGDERTRNIVLNMLEHITYIIAHSSFDSIEQLRDNVKQDKFLNRTFEAYRRSIARQKKRNTV